MMLQLGNTVPKKKGQVTVKESNGSCTLMNLESELTWIEVKQVADEIARQKTGKHLSDIEMIVLQGSWRGETYEEMAQQAGYTADYLNKDVGNKLWKKLSDILGEKVSKKNLREPLKRASKAQQQQQKVAVKNLEPSELSSAKQERSPLYPSGSVPLGSPFYLERAPIEEQVNQEIRKPGALIRIKAPREMGKTSMLVRILDCAKRLGYRTVSLNLEQVDQAILSDSNQFLRWLCANVARQLRLKPKLDEYWDEDLGSKISCTSYFQDYLLESIDTPLVLALDEVNQIFEHPQVAKDFLPLLRSWYEEAKTLPIWQKLRLLVVHSTEIYVPLQLNQSPFNVGLPVQLDSFSQEEVQQLAQRYGLDWADGEQAWQLMDLVGGHPSLVHTALYHLSQRNITLSQLLETAPTATGIYSHHLQRHWVTLEQRPELAQALDTVLNATEPVTLDPILSYKLSSMGVIKQSGDKAIAGCKLYRRYFTKKGVGVKS